MPHSQYKYLQVDDSCEDLDSNNLQQPLVITHRRPQYARTIFIICATCILFSVASVYVIYYPISQKYQPSRSVLVHEKSRTCRDPAVRQEWRSLSFLQRREYISAVRCLQNRPSTIGLDHTLHDEFTWIHSRLGNFSKLVPLIVITHHVKSTC